MTGPTPSCQVAKLLGSNVQLVYKELLALLQDEALEVSPSPTLSSVPGQDSFFLLLLLLLGHFILLVLWCRLGGLADEHTDEHRSTTHNISRSFLIVGDKLLLSLLLLLLLRCWML